MTRRRHIGTNPVSMSVSAPIQARARRLGAIESTDPSGKAAIDEAFVGAFRVIALIAAASAVSAGLTAWLTIRENQSDSATRQV
jgi:hypothetical protein